jgi:uncharacterized protein with von Willebrand factor type A (vWA) domain
MMSLLLPQFRYDRPEEEREEIATRLAEALQGDRAGGIDQMPADEEEVEIDAAMTFSDRELLQEMDFEKMTLAELAETKKAIANLHLPIMEVPTRRFGADPRGRRVDMRATLRASLRTAGAIPLKLKSPKYRHPPLVILCDISGSMTRYSRMALHFVHAITNDRDRVHTFLFGTRLTNITRDLRHRDVDLALDRVGAHVKDWSGGTRIGHCLHDFNVQWARRVLGQGAVVLLITDGLDREGVEGLEEEMIPLLRYDAYRPQSQGAKAMIRHVDDFRAIHNLDSMQSLADALGKATMRTERPQLKEPRAA